MSTTETTTSLLQALRQPGQDTVWRGFCARYEPVLLAIARRAGLREEDARDVSQETLFVFAAGLRSGRYDRERGRLRAWLRGIAVNKIRECRVRLVRPEQQVLDAGSGTGFLNRVPDQAELTDIFEVEWQRSVLAECLRLVQQQVDANTYEAFRLYALDSWPAERVAEHLGIERGVVYVSKSRVLARLRQLRQEMDEEA